MIFLTGEMIRIILFLFISLFTAGNEEEIDLPAELQYGVASYYADRFHGRLTANGEIYDTSALTAAHLKLPFGQEVRVTRLDNGKSVSVRINDRGPFNKARIIDLSKAAAKELDMLRLGLVDVHIELLNPQVKEESEDVDK